jgi:hypothetical protein
VWHLVRAGRIRGIDDIAGFLADWARLHRGLPPDLRLPSALWEPLCATWTEPRDDRLRPPVRWPFGSAVTAEAIRRWRKAARSGQGEAYVTDEFGLLVRWAADYAEEGRPRLTSYRNAVEAARRHDRRLRAAAATASSRPWDFPQSPEVFGRWIFVPLATPLDLVEEAIALHHCADQRAAACATDMRVSTASGVARTASGSRRSRCAGCRVVAARNSSNSGVRSTARCRSRCARSRSASSSSLGGGRGLCRRRQTPAERGGDRAEPRRAGFARRNPTIVLASRLGPMVGRKRI